jgi:cytochrome c553
MRASKPRFVIAASAVVVISGFLLAWTPAQAADVAAGRAKAAQCAACHGMNGMATLPEAPNLAGQNEIYLAKALHDFKSGDRKNEMMSLMAAALSETDIENLAAYYQSIQITVKEP